LIGRGTGAVVFGDAGSRGWEHGDEFGCHGCLVGRFLSIEVWYETEEVEVRNDLVEGIQAEGLAEVVDEADFIPIASAW
jgi:hypothetical protein